MRLNRISAPADKSTDFANIAFSCGINELSVISVEVLRKDAASKSKVSIDIELSTPKAKRFVDALFAAGLANIDDVGRREFLGLAATAQIAIIPVWFGICFVFGFPATDGKSEIAWRAVGFLLNVMTIVISPLATHIALGAVEKSEFKDV